jgi:hypothetical protein
MRSRKYQVIPVQDSPAALQECMDRIVAWHGRVVSVMWQPTRDVAEEAKKKAATTIPSGYVVVAEYEEQ